MPPKSPRWVEDIAGACANIESWTAGKTLADYESDAMLRAAVECAFAIIGEALLRLERGDPGTATQITDYRRIIGFRNRLAHNYDDTDQALVWEVIHVYLPILRAEVDAILTESGS